MKTIIKSYYSSSNKLAAPSKNKTFLVFFTTVWQCISINNHYQIDKTKNV